MQNYPADRTLSQSRNTAKSERTDMIHIFLDSTWLTLSEAINNWCELQANVHKSAYKLQKKYTLTLQNLLENHYILSFPQYQSNPVTVICTSRVTTQTETTSRQSSIYFMYNALKLAQIEQWILD